MKFSLDDFKKQYGEFIYNKLTDFINSEINERTVKTIRFFIENPQLSGLYEGNQYIISKERNDDVLTIIDEISEEHGVSSNQTRFRLEINELIDIINKKSNS